MSSGLTRSAATLIAVLGLSAAASATELPLTGDTYVSTARTTTNYGSSSNLYVGNGGTTYLQFGVTSLPAGTTSGQISKATLLVFANRVNTSGSVSVNSCSTSWSEAVVTSATAPTCAISVATFTPATAGAYVAVDVTALVQSWVSGSLANNGISLTSAAGDILFDSKENDQTAHPAKLDVTVLNATGTILSAGTTAGQVYLTGASGAVPSTPVSVSGDVSLSSAGAATIASGAVTIGKIGATGTPSSSTFLRGDGTWSTPSGGGVSSVTATNGNAVGSASITGSALTINFPSSVINFYSSFVNAGGGTSYLTNSVTAGSSGTFGASALNIATTPCTVGGLNVSGFTYVAGTADTITLTVYKSGSLSGTGGTGVAGTATAITCSVTVPTTASNTPVSCSDTAHTAALTLGDNFYVVASETGSTTTAAYFKYAVGLSCR